MGGRGQISASSRAKGPSVSTFAKVATPDYEPWESEGADESVIDKHVEEWKGSSSRIRHAINGRVDEGLTPQELKEARQFDDWLNSGSYAGDLYRGKRLTKDQLAEIKIGDIINQDGPASFSKDREVGLRFAKGGYNHQTDATQRTVFVLHGGTKAGRDISGMHGYADESEVAVGSSSHMRVTKVETEVIGGKHYTFVHGTEIKKTYNSEHQ